MATLPTNYQDATPPTGALTELPATTARGMNAITTQVNKNTNQLTGVVHLDSFAGADDDAKLTAALTYAAAQTFRPTIQLPARQITFSTSGRTPYDGMKIIGPNGANGPKNLEIGSELVNHQVFLNVGNGTSAWFNATTTVSNVYFGDIAFWEGNSNAQFWHGPNGVGPGLQCSQFHSLTFFGFKHIFGTPATSVWLTQCTFSGHWQVQAFRDQAMNLVTSDSDFWMDSNCNIGSIQTPTAGTPMIEIFGSKSKVGMIYATVQPGWKGLKLTGGDGMGFYGTILEGGNSGSPATQSVLEVTGGTHTFFGPNINYVDDVSANGCVILSGGNLTMWSPRYMRTSAVAATFPFIYQTGGTLYLKNGVALTGSELMRWRKTDTTTVTIDPTV